jgi:hypothetical protein
MAFQDEKEVIRWKIHLCSSPNKVHHFLSSDEGRAQFWAEKTEERNGVVSFHLLNQPYLIEGRVLENTSPYQYSIEYFASKVNFILEEDGKGGTLLQMTAFEVNDLYKMEMAAGWVTVLLSLKAAVDFGIDLRNHDSKRTWDQGFAND